MHTRPNKITLFFVLTLLVFNSLACQFGAADPTATPTLEPTDTATPEPTDTPPPTNTPEPTATITPDLAATEAVEATEEAQAIVDLVMVDLEEIGMSEEPGSLGWLQDEPVRINVSGPGTNFYEPFPSDVVAANFVIKTTVQWESENGFVGCGFIFRSEDNFERGQQYIFQAILFSGLPAWDIELWDNGGFVKNVTDRVRTAGAIHQTQDSFNDYILVAKGGQFTLYVNGERIGSYYDYSETRTEGIFAFIGWVSGGRGSCEYTETWVWLLDD
jgi:hypothetical protein